MASQVVNSKKKAAPTRKSNNGITFAMMAVVLALLIVLVLMLTGKKNTLQQVEIRRSGMQGSEAYLSDETIVRAAGLKMGAAIEEVDDMREQIERGVNSLGLVSFESVERVSNTDIRLNVKVRTPCLAVASGSGYILIDREGYIMDRREDVKNMNVLKVKGMTLAENQKNGVLAESSPKTLLPQTMEVAYAVIDGGYTNMISEMMIFNGSYRLVTTAGLIATFYMGDDMNRMLSIVKGALDEGYTSGEVIISDGQAAYSARIVTYDYDVK